MSGHVIAGRNKRVGAMALGIAAAMLGLGYASVPLYRMFCQVTGFDGTTQRATEAQAAAIRSSGKPMSIRFDANVDENVPWIFRPERNTTTIVIGERNLAIFTARNTSSETVTGIASFNVEPEWTGKYFNKIQCFCFSQQTLKPGEEVRMPVIYYVDPAILKDEHASDVEQITLSYTFHRAKLPQNPAS